MNILLSNKSSVYNKIPLLPHPFISSPIRQQWFKSIILLAILVNIAGFSGLIQASCSTYKSVSENLSVGTYVSEAAALQGMDDYWSTVDFNVFKRGLRSRPCANYSFIPGHAPLRHRSGNYVQLYQSCVGGTFNDTNCTNIHYHVFAYYPIEGASCPEGQAPNQQTGRCEADAEVQLAKDAKHFGAPDCPVGNPCDPATGNKYQQEIDISGEATGLSLIRHYNSGLGSIDNGFGYGWTHQLAPSLEVSASLIVVHQADGRAEAFRKTGAQWLGDSDTQLSLSQDSTGFTLHTDQGRRERYDLTGHILSQTELAGQSLFYSYNSEQQLETLTGPFGHVLTFGYNADHRIASVTDAAQQVVQYHYDELGNLVNITYPDQSTRQYHYENPDYPHALTGITDENDFRYATYTYNAAGQAIATAHAQTDSPVPQEQFQLRYEDNQTTVTDANGHVEILRFAENLGVKNLISRIHQSDGKGVTQRFDAQNNLISRTDPEGTTTEYTYNTAQQRISQTEAVGTPLARTTEFHYLSKTVDRITDIASASVVPGNHRHTRLEYNPDHTVKSLTLDGYQPDGTAIQRRHTFQTNSLGQVTRIDGPLDDVEDITTFSYYDCDTGGRCGQLASLSNALNHTVTFDHYDQQGRLTQQTDPQSVVTTYRYDARGRLTNITETPPPGQGSPRAITYRYDNVGQLTTLILPDGQELSYQYDAAHQLRRIRDQLGNQQSYRYDANGNQTQVDTLDPDGALVRTLQLSYDSRNRVTTINQAGSISRMIRDAIGNPLSQTDAKQNPDTTYQHDALHRLIQTLDSLGQSIRTHYDHQDHLIQVEAPNQAVTDYQVDDLGNRLQETSADRGTVSYRHDMAGNITHVTDARDITRTLQYDALNRVTSIDYSGNEEDITYRYDDCPNGIGRLCQIDDASGITQYRYDSWGNILAETRHTQDTIVTTHYTYDAADRIQTLTYPDGSTVHYQRDRIGRVTGVSRLQNGTATSLISNRHYRADGLMTGQTLGNGLSETRHYDLQGRLSQQTLGEDINRSYQYDANGNLISQQQASLEQHYDYDELDRLIAETQQGTSQRSQEINYHYDANGNRLSTDRDGRLRLLDYEAASNRLSDNNQHTVNRDAAGNTLSDRKGRWRYTYNQAGRLENVYKKDRLIARYQYNSQGLRTQKILYKRHKTTTFSYFYDFSGQLIAEYKNQKPLREYIWIDNQPQVQIKVKQQRNGTIIIRHTTYLTTDHLNTPRIGTDEQQNLVWRWQSDGFGKTKPERFKDYQGKKRNILLRFPGQYHDQETGLHYNGMRYYDPKTGRYITSDPIGLAGGLNTFAYVGGNPLKYTDPQGLFFWDLLDVGFFAQSLYTYTQCPNTDNAINLGLDGIGLLPGIPALGSLRRIDDAIDVTKRGADWFDDVARNATRNSDSTKLVLGHFSHEGTSYQKVAAHYKATYFKVNDWNTVTKGLSLDEIWRINKTFLIQQVKQGKQILFSHNPLNARRGTFFEREVDFLRDLGYKFRQKNKWAWEAVK